MNSKKISLLIKWKTLGLMACDAAYLCYPWEDPKQSIQQKTEYYASSLAHKVCAARHGQFDQQHMHNDMPDHLKMWTNVRGTFKHFKAGETPMTRKIIKRQSIYLFQNPNFDLQKPVDIFCHLQSWKKVIHSFPVQWLLLVLLCTYTEWNPDHLI